MQYTTTARDPGQVVEPIATIGGPILTDRLWFFAGYIPQLEKNKRTVTFTQNRAAGAQTFSNSREDHNINYNVTAQLTSSLHQKFAGSHNPTTGSVGLPGLEPDYISGQAGVLGDRVSDAAFRTSTANPANFPGVLYTNQFNNRYATTTDWVVSPKLYLSLTAGYLSYGSRGQTLTEFNTNTRRTFSQSNNVFPEVPANLVQPSGYVGRHRQHAHREGRLHRGSASTPTRRTTRTGWGSTRSRAACSSSSSATRSTPASRPRT